MHEQHGGLHVPAEDRLVQRQRLLCQDHLPSNQRSPEGQCPGQLQLELLPFGIGGHGLFCGAWYGGSVPPPRRLHQTGCCLVAGRLDPTRTACTEQHRKALHVTNSGSK